MKTRHLRWFIGMFGLQGCASEPLTTFDAYGGVRLPDNELAIIGELHGPVAGLETITQGRSVIWKRRASLEDQDHFFGSDVDREQIRLKPGRYQIDFVLWCKSDYAFLETGSAFYVGLRKSAELDRIAGHTYSTGGKHWGYACRIKGVGLWIEDQTEKRVVAGDAPE